MMKFDPDFSSANHYHPKWCSNPQIVFAMKTYFIVLGLLGASTAIAQRLEEKSIAWQPGQAVSLDLKYAREIQITTWERDEVSLRVSVSINDDTKNDAWSMTTNTTDDCPGHSYHLGKGRYCSLIVYEIYLPRAAALRVETLGGNITLRGLQAPVYAKSLSGFVDADWSAQRGATVTMKSITGEVYTNLDLGLNEAGEVERYRESPVGWEIEGEVDGGGVPVQLESISDDVYFRRAGS